MSKATMDLHHNIKKPGAIIFSSLLALFGITIFPGGLILVFGLGFLQEVISFPDYLIPIVILSLGIVGMFYSIVSDIYDNLQIHKAVIIELIKFDVAQSERTK